MTRMSFSGLDFDFGFLIGFNLLVSNKMLLELKWMDWLIDWMKLTWPRDTEFFFPNYGKHENNNETVELKKRNTPFWNQSIVNVKWKFCQRDHGTLSPVSVTSSKMHINRKEERAQWSKNILHNGLSNQHRQMQEHTWQWSSRFLKHRNRNRWSRATLSEL